MWDWSVSSCQAKCFISYVEVLICLDSLQNQIITPEGTPLAPTSNVAQLISAKIPGYKQRLSGSLSNTSYTI